MDTRSNEGGAFAIFDYLSDAVAVTDSRFELPGPKVIYVNDALVDACGRPKKEVLGQALSTLHLDLANEDRLAALEKCCRGKRTYKNKGPFPEPDGTVTSRAWHIAPVFGDNGLSHLICLISRSVESPELVNALRASERRYRNLFRQGLVGKAIVKADGRFAEVNDSFCNLVGYTRDELVGAHSSMVIREQERDGVFERLERIVNGKQSGYQTERQYLHKQGHTVTVLLDVMPESNAEGEIVAVVIQAQDISDLKATEAGLRESESQLKAIFDHSPAEIYLKDAEGRYVRINRQFERMFNVRNEDLQGKLPHDAHYKELADQTRDHDLEVLRTGRAVVREQEALLENPPDAFPHVLHTIKFPVFDDGNIAGLGAIVMDITDLKRSEQALRESEGRLRDFAEIAADWFWETDENLVVTYISDVHRVITGIPDEQIFGRTREELFDRKIYRGVDPEVHLRTLKSRWESVIEYTVTRPDGKEVVIHDRASPFFNADGEFRGYRGVGRDITEQKRLNKRIAHQATRDPLTGTANRRELERCLDEAIAESHVQGRIHVLCFTDLNKFKLLNDTLGHAAGDYSLRTIVEKIQQNISSEDILGRIGGDEFGILLRDKGIDTAKRIAEHITGAIRDHEFTWQDHTFNITMSIGLAPIDKYTKSTSELMARADSACYCAKESGSNGVWVSDEGEAARLRTYSDILLSLASDPVDLSDKMRLMGQPIRSLSNGGADPAWYEVLLRVVGADGHDYRPYEFIRLAEQRGEMPLIDQWVLEQALVAHGRLVERNPRAVLSINVAGNSLSDTRLLGLMDGLLKDSPVKPSNLCFEIGESTAIIDLERTLALTNALSSQGFRIALDEFGRGPSSFECLKKLPVDYLKLYGNLVRELNENGRDLAIVESLRDMSRRLGLGMVAVQVETDEVARTLQRIGVDYGQGEALARIRPLDNLVAELAG